MTCGTDAEDVHVDVADVLSEVGRGLLKILLPTCVCNANVVVLWSTTFCGSNRSPTVAKTGAIAAGKHRRCTTTKDINNCQSITRRNGGDDRQPGDVNVGDLQHQPKTCCSNGQCCWDVDQFKSVIWTRLARCNDFIHPRIFDICIVSVSL